MSVEKISKEATALAEKVQKIDIESAEQKASQVVTQAVSEAEQAKAKIADQVQDAKAALDKLNKELGKIPQKIEDKLDEAILALEKALGWSPEIKKIKIKKPDGTEIEVKDFDPDKILKELEKVIDPVLAAIGPVETVAGKIPVIGDLVSLLTTLSKDKSGESAITKEDVLAMVPEPPDIPPTIYKKIGRLMQLIQQFVQELPIILIDVIFQMLSAIYDMFDQIVGVIGVPPAIFPFSLIKSVVALPPKIKTMIQQMPSQADTLITEKLKQKFQYAMALSVPKPNLSEIKESASNIVSNTASSVLKPALSQPPPAESNIQETPSVPEATPLAPIAPEIKPEITINTNGSVDFSI